MTITLISGWFDNQMTLHREVWFDGELHRAWPRESIESSPELAPWGSYPGFPEGLAGRSRSGLHKTTNGKGSISY